MMCKPKALCNLVRLCGYGVLGQLRLEERLLRTSSSNWCILNDGTHPPAIVMGISGNPAALLDLPLVTAHRVPVIKRFSGGGTVVVDGGTALATLICSRDAVPKLPLFPRPIMSWTQEFYTPVFGHVPGFHLREHDYVFGDLKFGGNAQSIIKDRWLHHTSFLWDYEDSRMSYLKIPTRAPNYRLGRSHGVFLCKLKDFLPSRKIFLESIIDALKQHFTVTELTLDDIDQVSDFNYLRSTKMYSDSELREYSKQ